MKRRRRYTLQDPIVNEWLSAYSDGMPRYVICEEWGIGNVQLRRLIKEYEEVNGPLRTNKVIREKKRRYEILDVN